MKCSACQNNECEGKYEKRHKCVGKKEKIKCTCKCKVTARESILTSTASVGIGIAATAAGIGLTVATGGLFAIIAGASIVGAGSSLILSPIQKQITGECMTASETIKDIALSATIGGITGPLGAGANALAKGASGIARIGIRALAGSSAGAVSGAICEGAKYMNGEKVTSKSFIKSVSVGAVVGTVGGFTAQVASSASNKVSGEVTKAATRVAVQGTSAAATDATIQIAQTGKIDTKQLLLNTTGQLTVATTAEVSASLSQRTTAYNNRMNEELMQKNNVTPEDARKFNKIIEKANAVNKEKLETGKKIGSNNLHILKGDRAGQIAGDYGPKSETGGRGAGRLILEEHRGNKYYVDHTAEHKYQDCQYSIKSNRLHNPLDGNLRADQVRANLTFVDDEIDENKKKV
ncbi:hypothetical protein PVAND_016711 [Polypedilum vanderplanki]|uniref:Uncharacterized protein n=1 Tax=Polypedilum vanderplanki TaxID=319348 RepID=A0A9J6BFX4_POLVA|nr:hypothetical protein PVAND_016711 [Polypedilum vanderplanki]